MNTKINKHHNLILVKACLTCLILSCMGFLIWWPYHIENNPYLAGRGFFYWLISTKSFGILIEVVLLPIGTPLILAVWNKLKKLVFLSWFGLYLFVVFMAYATMCLSDIVDANSWWQGRHLAVGFFPILLSISVVGIPFMFYGAIKSNPRCFWFTSIIVGLIYLIEIVIYASAVLSWRHSLPNLLLLFFVGIPGYLSILLGFILIRKKIKEKVNKSL